MEGPLQLNLTEIIETRAGKRGKWIPRFLLRGLERVIRQDGLNELLRIAYPAEGAEFCDKILEHLDIEVQVSGLADYGAPVVFASNHPLGGLDGIALVKVLGHHLGDDNLKVMVNDLLMNVTPLAGVFLPTNKFGKKGARESSRLLTEALDSGKNVVMFAAGLVSRLCKPIESTVALEGNPGNRIRDLEWRKTFVSKALEHNRLIVPIRFEALNSMKFYRTAKVRKRLGIKVNIEQALLPAEIFKSRGKKFKITFLPPVDVTKLAEEGKKPQEIAEIIYKMVYGIKKHEPLGTS